MKGTLGFYLSDCPQPPPKSGSPGSVQDACGGRGGFQPKSGPVTRAGAVCSWLWGLEEEITEKRAVGAGCVVVSLLGQEGTGPAPVMGAVGDTQP